MRHIDAPQDDTLPCGRLWFERGVQARAFFATLPISKGLASHAAGLRWPVVFFDSQRTSRFSEDVMNPCRGPIVPKGLQVPGSITSNQIYGSAYRCTTCVLGHPKNLLNVRGTLKKKVLAIMKNKATGIMLSTNSAFVKHCNSTASAHITRCGLQADTCQRVSSDRSTAAIFRTGREG